MESAVISESPSLGGHSSGRFLDVAADLIASSPSRKMDDDEVPREKGGVIDEVEGGEGPREKNGESDGEEEDESEEFEFGGMGSSTDEFCTLSADELFADGRIRTLHEIFHTRPGLVSAPPVIVSGSPSSATRPNLKKLLLEERAMPTTDELDGIAEGTYCVWTPRSPQPECCKKSNSTGNSSRRWRFRNILHRSNSDGKEMFVFMAPPQKEEVGEKGKEHQVLDSLFRRHHHRKTPDSPERQKNVGGKGQHKKDEERRKEKTKKEGFTIAHEIHYVKAREGDRRRSYLPYKQDLVGFFGNLNIHHHR